MKCGAASLAMAEKYAACASLIVVQLAAGDELLAGELADGLQHGEPWISRAFGTVASAWRMRLLS